MTHSSARAEARLTELCRAYVGYHAGLAPTLSLAPVHARYADLLAPTQQAQLRTSWQSSPDGQVRRRRGLLYGDCVRNIVRCGVARDGEQLAARVRRAEVTVGGRRLAYPKALHALGQARDRGERKALSAATREVTKSLNDGRADYLAAEHREVAALDGVANYRAFHEIVRGVDFRAAGSLARGFLANTRQVHQAEVLPWLAQTTGDEPDADDIIALRRRVAPQDWFPADRLRPALQRTLADLGFGADVLGRIAMDLAKRPGKSARGLCMPVRVPGEVYVSVLPTGGMADYRTLFHEVGHALHFALTDPTRPFEERCLGDNAVGEAFAFLLEHIVLDETWLSRHLGLGATAIATLQADARRMRLYEARRAAAQHLFELELHAGSTAGGEPMDARYATLLTDHTGVRHHAADYMASCDPGFSAGQYLRAWCLEAQLRRTMVTTFGPVWTSRPDAGRLLRDLWAQGHADDADAVARRLGYVGVSAGPLIADLTAINPAQNPVFVIPTPSFADRPA